MDVFVVVLTLLVVSVHQSCCFAHLCVLYVSLFNRHLFLRWKMLMIWWQLKTCGWKFSQRNNPISSAPKQLPVQVPKRNRGLHSSHDTCVFGVMWPVCRGNSWESGKYMISVFHSKMAFSEQQEFFWWNTESCLLERCAAIFESSCEWTETLGFMINFYTTALFLFYFAKLAMLNIPTKHL